MTSCSQSLKSFKSQIAKKSQDNTSTINNSLNRGEVLLVIKSRLEEVEVSLDEARNTILELRTKNSDLELRLSESRNLNLELEKKCQQAASKHQLEV